MKKRISFSALAAALLLPCFAALNFIISSWIGVLFWLTAIWLVISVFKPSALRARYPKIYPLHDGSVMLGTFRTAAVFHIIEFILLITFLRVKLGIDAASIITIFIIMFIVNAYAAQLLLVLGGGIRVIIKSTQLSLTTRVLMIMLFWIPIANFFVMGSAQKTARSEFEREAARIDLDNARAENEICKTKYPILLVHGIFFRDLYFFNYWGRVPAELIKNGAQIYYGNQPSAASVAECGEFLKRRIEEIVAMTGCEKVNIIAHSKGGLDVRYAASMLGMNKYIASITTINTPHLGCRYADFLMERLPSSVLPFIAAKYNAALSKLGENADFIAGVTDLTAQRCFAFNNSVSLPEGVYCRSVGTYMKKSTSAGFPLNFAYILVRLFSRTENDGLVDLESMRWGEDFIVYEPKTKRGISHGDVIDLLREDIKGFDVREVYVKLAEDLKNKGF